MREPGSETAKLGANSFTLSEAADFQDGNEEGRSRHGCGDRTFTGRDAGLPRIERIVFLKRCGVDASGRIEHVHPAPPGIEEAAEDSSAKEMVLHLVSANEKLLEDLKAARDCAGAENDSETEDLMIARIQVHEKTVWMLKSFLE